MMTQNLPVQTRKPRRRQTALLVLLFWLAVLAFGFYKFNAILDWWKLRGYTPPAAVTALAIDDGMNAYTTHLFYVNHPQLLPTVNSFRTYCPENKDTIVLGCYHPDQDGIYIYNVQDPTLQGLTQVTAAHEVLHSVYARLSSSARKQLDAELQDYYDHGLTDARVKAEVAIYQKTEPKDVMDEMSCTFGTEIASLPTALENYYKQFFTDRQKIVAYEQQYEGQFTNRTAQITADDAQLTSLKKAIDLQETDLKIQNTQITADRANLNSLLKLGDTASYNADVPEFNASVDSYNSAIDKLQADITTYNALVVSRNAVAGQLTTLASAIDTRLTAQSTK